MNISDEEKKRAQECSAEVTEVLKKHNCQISARVIITELGTQIQTAIVAKSSIIQPIKPLHNG